MGMLNANHTDRSGPGGSGRSSNDISDIEEKEQRTCGHGGLRGNELDGLLPVSMLSKHMSFRP
jgi:hypothetical protein